MTTPSPALAGFLAWLALSCCVPALSASEPAAVLPVSADGPKVRPARSLQFGFNLSIMFEIAYRNFGYDRPELREAVQRLQPRLLRYPGGTYANNYLWREDGFADATGDLTGWAGEQVSYFRTSGKKLGLDKFIALCREQAATPLFTYNVFEGTPQDACDFVQRVEQLGGNVPFLELANEPYWDPRALDRVEAYLAQARPIAQALKTFRPALKIGVCLAPFDNPANYEKRWNAPIMAEPFFDAVIFHEYHGKQGLGLEKSKSLDLAAIANPEPVLDEMLAKLRQTAPGFPVWLTEYNIGWDHLGTVAYTGAHGLYLASVFAWMTEHGEDIELAAFHQLYQAGFGTFYLDEQTGAKHYTASFLVWRLLGAVSAGATQVIALPRTQPRLVTIGFAGAGGRQLLIINKEPKTLTLTLAWPGGRPIQNWTATSLAYGNLGTKIANDSDPTTTRGGTGPLCPVPPYSITAIRLDGP